MEEVNKPDASLEERIHLVLDKLQQAGEGGAKSESTDKETGKDEELGPLLLGGGQEEEAEM